MRWALVTFGMMALLAWLVYCDYHDDRRKEKAAVHERTWTLNAEQMRKIVRLSIIQEQEIRRLKKLLAERDIPIPVQ